MTPSGTSIIRCLLIGINSETSVYKHPFLPDSTVSLLVALCCYMRICLCSPMLLYACLSVLSGAGADVLLAVRDHVGAQARTPYDRPIRQWSAYYRLPTVPRDHSHRHARMQVCNTFLDPCQTEALYSTSSTGWLDIKLYVLIATLQ